MKLSEMTDEQKRIECAEAMGWTDVNHRSLLRDRILIEGILGKPPTSALFHLIPDFLNDLNACHEMEKVLADLGNEDNYWLRLRGSVQGNTSGAWAFRLVHATAREKCDAFLLATGRAEL